MQQVNGGCSASISIRALRYGASCLALSCGLMVSPALAQDQEAADTASEETAEDGIVVTGFKGSLQTAQAIKRKSDVIVDSVSAEDIGALPDRSVTETLQRIPGVSIDRFAAGEDPDRFSVEGSGVTIRGLSYVRSEINGREAFSVNNGRGLSFADVPSELLFGVDVFKSPSSDRIEGGISGVVNLRTRKPFDQSGLMVAGSIENTYSDFAKKSAPTFSALISDRWETGIGEFGLLVSGVSSKLNSRSDRVHVAGFGPRTLYAGGSIRVSNTIPYTRVATGGTVLNYGPNIISSNSLADQAPVSAAIGQVYTPSGGGFGSTDYERKRYGLSGALQWRSNDGSVEASVQYFRSDARQDTHEFAVDIDAANANDRSRNWCNNETQAGDPGPCSFGPRAVPGTALTFDSNGLFTSGVLTSGSGWRDDQFRGDQARTPVFGLEARHINRAETFRNVTEDISANLKWNISDRFAASIDYQHVSASVDNFSASLWNSSYNSLSIDMNDGGIPTVQLLAPQVCRGPAANDPIACNSNPAGGYVQTGHNYFSAGHTDFADPYNTYYYAAMDHAEKNNGKSDAVRLDFSYDLPENNWIKGIEFGGRYSKRDQTVRFSLYNWGALSAQWGNGGPIWLDNPNVASSGYELNSYPNFFGGQAEQPNSGRLFYSGNGANDYAGYTAFATTVVNAWRRQGGLAPNQQTGSTSGWVPLAQRPNVLEDVRDGLVPVGSNFDSSEVNPLSEKNKSAYLLAKIDHKFDNGWDLTGSVGVRYTGTDRTSFGNIGSRLVATPGNALVTTATAGTTYVIPTEFDCNLRTQVVNGVTVPRVPPAVCANTTTAQRDAVRNFFNGKLTPTESKLSYDYFLPSINLRLDTGNGLQFRLAYSKGIAPPDTGFVRSNWRATADTSGVNYAQLYPGAPVVLVVEAGNPNLKPVTSNNFDFTTEWYFNNSIGRLTFAAFYKEIKGINVPGFFPADITNNGVTLPAVLRTAVNSPSSGKVKGVELGYEQTYDFLPGFLNGLGLSANVTFIDQGPIEQGSLSKAYPNLASAGNSANATVTDISKLPLVGLSKWNVNIAPFYQKGPLEIRLGYNWRSRFLLTVQDVIFPYQPTYNNAAGYLDGSISVAVNKHFKLGLQATNILDTITKTSAVIDRDAELVVPRSYFKNDRTFKIYARLNW
jgi:TonB-dependent receptor